MARIIDVITNKLSVGFNYLERYYYVTHRDTTTTRLTSDEAFEIVGVISPSSATPELKSQIISLATTIEELTDIYCALEDTGLGVKAVWFNTYKDFAIVYNGSTLLIRNTDIVFTISYYTVKSKIVNSIQNFFLTKIGLEISYEDLSVLYDYLISTSYNKPVYNNITPRVNDTDAYTFSNILSTSDKSKVNYTATYNPNEEYTYNIFAGDIESIDTENNQIIMDNVYSNLTGVKKIKVSGATLYIDNEKYTDDGVYHLLSTSTKSFQDQDYTWHNGYKYSYAYNYLIDKYENATEERTDILLDSPNFKILGYNMTVDSNGIASGFNDWSFLGADRFFWFTDASYTNWEFGMKFNLSQLGVESSLIGNSRGNCSFLVRIYTDNKMHFWAGNDGSNWNMANNVVGSKVFVANKDYWLKVTYNGSYYLIAFSEDGETYVNDYQLNNASKVYWIDPVIGRWGTETNTFLRGSVDMKECYLKVNDSYMWTGYDAITYKVNENYKITTPTYSGVTNYIKDRDGGACEYYILDQDNHRFKIPCSPLVEATPNKLPTNTVLNVEETLGYNYNPSANIASVDSVNNTITLTNNYTALELQQGDKFTVKNTEGKRFAWANNVILYGSLIGQDGVYYNFNGSSFIDLLSYNFTYANNWEIVTKVKVSSFASNQHIYGTRVGSYPLSFKFSTAGKFVIYLSSNNSSWNIANGTTGTNTFRVNTDYWIRLRFDSTAYYADYSEDGINFTTDIYIVTSARLYPLMDQGYLRLGCYGGSEPLTYGSIDLKESYINMDGKRVWDGAGYEDYNSDGVYTIDNVYLDGYRTVIKPFETVKQSYTAPLNGPYPTFTPNTAPDVYSGTPNDSILLDVTNTRVPDRFPKGKFLLDNSEQLTEYIEAANMHCNNIIPVPTVENYGRFNTEIPASIEVAGLDLPLQFAGLYSELFTS